MLVSEVLPHVVLGSSRSLPKLPVETKRMKVPTPPRSITLEIVFACGDARWYPKCGVAQLPPYCLNPKPKRRPSVSPKPQDKGCGSLLGVWNGTQHCFSTARPNPTSPPRLRHSPMAASSRCPTATKQADASPRRSRDPILGALQGRASGSQRQSSSKSTANGRRNGVSGHFSAEMGRDITPGDCPPGPRSGCPSRSPRTPARRVRREQEGIAPVASKLAGSASAGQHYRGGRSRIATAGHAFPDGTDASVIAVC